MLKKGFTLIEIMLVIAMIGILAAGAFYLGGPYLSRSRDVSRFADLQQYSRILDVYYKDHDTLPSNFSGATRGFCADEVFFERDNVPGQEDGQFRELGALMAGSPLRDPMKSNPPISVCTRSGSYLYSKVDSISGKLYSVLGARMSIISNGNYLTASAISSTGQVSGANLLLMQPTYKGTISDTTEGSTYYFVATQH